MLQEDFDANRHTGRIHVVCNFNLKCPHMRSSDAVRLRTVLAYKFWPVSKEMWNKTLLEWKTQKKTQKRGSKQRGAMKCQRPLTGRLTEACVAQSAEVSLTKKLSNQGSNADTWLHCKKNKKPCWTIPKDQALFCIFLIVSSLKISKLTMR